MPFHRAIPQSKSDDKPASGFKSYVEAEKLGQIAFVLPSAVVICGLAGFEADRLLHQKWMLVAGIIFGSISGIYYVIQTAYAAEKTSRKEDAAQNGTGKTNPPDPS
jgi:F0F1-type ATP synthase assembly protein I